MLRCQHCGTTFHRPNARGPVPKFCSASCRQRAYEKRIRDKARMWDKEHADG